MKSIENAIDLGVGIIILVLVASTAFFGLMKYARQDIRHELSDKNTVSMDNIKVLAFDDIAQGTDRQMEEAVLAAAENKDNIRETRVLVKTKNSTDDATIAGSKVVIKVLTDTTMATIQKAEKEAKAEFVSTYGDVYQTLLDNHKYKSATTLVHGLLTCYIIIEE